MTTPNDHDIHVLNSLIETTIDSADGYREAAKETDKPGYRSLFEARSFERQQVAVDLQGTVRNLGGEPEDDGSILAKNISSSTLKEDAYAFIFDQRGLMVSLSIEGTKISRIKR